MGLQLGQDPQILREQEYADDGHLDVRRRTHQLYTVDPVDFGRWTLERLTWQGDERVLDVGCGPGELLCEMARQHGGWRALVGLDFSPGMIAKAADLARNLPVHFFVGDAQGLPFADASFEVVLARHMLYHVPDIGRAVAEAARVLGAGGRFLTVTNSAHTMAECAALRRTTAAHLPAMVQPEFGSGRFSLENAPAWLQSHFGEVQTHVLRGTLRFPSAQPFMDYFASARAMSMLPAHSETEWQAVLDYVRATVEAVIARQGHFDVSKVAGAVVGVKRS
jgi:SAM-dependent methyltransferase